ncbi:aspartate carbamoyltransferase catalytic chain [Nitzschia inconspicua]|uniref:Aspartate carbamoyltransferase catalytic chain n=1 Tax=Nitzschia inconspicua TaxID=303405 RepID=A0A9K3KHZ0_9STRA|nr:aspartate carbamoyltransferase catalytic chain [Nitzschia inconspicua]
MTRLKDCRQYTWEEFDALPLDKSNELLQGEYKERDGIYHTLNAEQFDRQTLDRIYVLTNIIRSISKTKNGATFLMNRLRHKRAMLYFAQASTRTYLSFKTAADILGIRCTDVRDTSTSSEIKGESFSDTIRTFSSYFDFIVMRHKEESYAEQAAWALNCSDRPVPVLNAGSGKDQHPTQALLDIYTLRRSFEKNGGIEGKTILMAGDLNRGRTARSLSKLLALFPGIKIIFSAPHGFGMRDDVLSYLRDHGVEYSVSDTFLEHVSDADAIYMTRVQDEHDQSDGTSSKRSYEEFSLKEEHLKLLKKDCAIMHPLPRRDELDPNIDKDPRAKYWRQERNGMWTRAALLAITGDIEGQIQEYWRDLSRQASHTGIIQVEKDDKNWKPMERTLTLDHHLS